MAYLINQAEVLEHIQDFPTEKEKKTIIHDRQRAIEWLDQLLAFHEEPSRIPPDSEGDDEPTDDPDSEDEPSGGDETPEEGQVYQESDGRGDRILIRGVVEIDGETYVRIRKAGGKKTKLPLERWFVKYGHLELVDPDED